ncbi:cysteine ABC transporter permease [Clostridium sp. MF28]|uniref:amino acid ABC transporter permease n=1 Tax=Clostridium TaxID=1485 RepID=UPI000CF9CA56|nr:MULTISPECIES: amino acid ABC transporter permease [Clostridium]AVK50438.1 cysteine ABC transporter permease [Clostridium sp. MF28]PSM59163.1 cysteine ABC transporter permease [Clostridium diolis]
MVIDNRIIEIIKNSFFPMLEAGLIYTIPLTIVSFAIGLLIAVLVALIQISKLSILKQIVKFYVWIFRGTPLLVQLFIIFYGLPNVGIKLEPIPSAIIAFSLNVGAYSSETIRAAILSVPKGQWEASYSLGMNYWQTLRRTIFPQAGKVSVPPLFNTFIALVKDTSLAANVTVTEMFMETQRIVARTYEPLVLYCEVAVFYLLFCTILSQIQKYSEKKLSIG